MRVIAKARIAASTMRRAPSPARLAIACLFALLAVAGSGAPVAGAATKAVLSSVGVPTGEEGAQLTWPTGIGVNREGVGGLQGSFYVAEATTNHRISQFDANGEFIRTWGYGVIKSGRPNDNGGGFEICDVTNGNAKDDCKAGEPGFGAGQLNNPLGVAIDQSTGYVYAVGESRRIDIFTGAGVFVGAFGWGVDTGAATLEVCTTLSGCQASAAAGAEAGNLQSLAVAYPALDPAVPGRIYVPDPGALRVSEYQVTISAGVLIAVSFEKAFGWDVVPGGAAQLESCTAVSGCQAGTSGSNAGQFTERGSPSAVAIDSSGAIYVTSGPLVHSLGTCSAATPCRIQKFSPDASSATTFGPATGPGQLVFTAEPANAVAALNIAIDPSNDHVFVLRKGKGPGGSEASSGDYQVHEYDSAGAYIATHPAPAGASLTGYSVTTATGLAVGTEERIYAGYGVGPFFSGTSELVVLGPVPAAVPTIDNPSDVTATTATFHGEVDIPSPGAPAFQTTFHFEYSSDGTDWMRTPAEDEAVADGSPGSHPVEAEVAGLEPNTGYLVRLAASTGGDYVISEPPPAEFTTLASAPRVPLLYADEVSQDAATLSAHIDPEGLDTTYRFEWATPEEWAASETYKHRVPAVDAGIGDGNEPVIAGEPIAGLQPASTYRFRVVATNAVGETVASGTFETLSACNLPNGRCLELVSPPDKGASGSVAETVETGTALQVQVDPEGAQVAYDIAYGLPDATASNEVLYEARRAAGGWTTTQRAPGTLVSSNTKTKHYPSGTLGLSSDLSCALFKSDQPLTADSQGSAALENGFALLFRGAQDGAMSLLTPEDPTNAGAYGGSPVNPYRVVGMSEAAGAACERVIFRTDLYYPGVDGQGTYRLYEWDRGTMRNVGVIPGPGGSEPAGTIPGAFIGVSGAAAPGNEARPGWPGGPNVLNAVSKDASRVFFTAISKFGGDTGELAVFLRDHASGSGDVAAGSVAITDLDVDAGMFAVGQDVGGAGIPAGTTIAAVSEEDDVATGLTLSQAATAGGADVLLDAFRSIDVSQSQTGVPNASASRYELASHDGEHVFFSARYGLAGNNEGAGPVECELLPVNSNGGQPSGPGCALYRYSAASGELIDLSVADGEVSNPNGPSVAGVLGASRDGSVVFFAARGQLLKGRGPSEAGNLASNTYSVYRVEVAGGSPALQYVGTIDGSGASNAFTATSGTGQWVSQVSSDGRHLLFSSGVDLSEYGAEGTRQAYLYDSADGSLECVSCPRDGEPSVPGPSGFTNPLGRGGLDTGNAAHPPLRLLAGEGGEEAKAYFTSYDDLAFGAVEGQRNFYQWDEGQISLIGSSSLGSPDNVKYGGVTDSGEEVFFTSFDQLNWEDKDNKSDLYVAKVGGGFPQPPLVPGCNPLAEASCQPPAAPAPAAGSPGSAAVDGPGNLVGPGPANRCARSARRAKRLSNRAKRLRRAARNTKAPAGKRKRLRAVRRSTRSARRLSRNAKRCRARASRQAKTTRRAGK